ncbi:MAG: glycosyltransferase [Gallionella sp.]
MPKIYILLPVHNRKDITRGFVECLRAQTFTDYQLVLIDDGSSDGTAEMVKEYIPAATVLRGTGDWWWAGSLQQGIEWLRRQNISDDDMVLIINDDVSIKEDFLKIGVKLLEDTKNALLQARIYCNKTNELIGAGKVFDGKTLEFRPALEGEDINCLTTNGLFVRWCDLKRIGNFYTKLMPHYISDLEFTIRAHARGLRLKSPPELVLHWNMDTTGLRQYDPDISFWEFIKSYFSKKHVMNPLHWTAFVLLGEYVQHRPRHIYVIWARAGRDILAKALRSSKRFLFGHY